MENLKNKQKVLISFTNVEKDNSLPADVKKYRKDVIMLETFLEIRDLLKDLANKTDADF